MECKSITHWNTVVKDMMMVIEDWSPTLIDSKYWQIENQRLHSQSIRGPHQRLWMRRWSTRMSASHPPCWSHCSPRSRVSGPTLPVSLSIASRYQSARRWQEPEVSRRRWILRRSRWSTSKWGRCAGTDCPWLNISLPRRQSTLAWRRWIEPAARSLHNK